MIHRPFRLQPEFRARIVGLTATPMGSKINIRERDIKLGLIEDKFKQSLELVQRLLSARIVRVPEKDLEEFRKVRGAELESLSLSLDVVRTSKLDLSLLNHILRFFINFKTSNLG